MIASLPPGRRRQIDHEAAQISTDVITAIARTLAAKKSPLRIDGATASGDERGLEPRLW
jgi:hypothetical protein